MLPLPLRFGQTAPPEARQLQVGLVNCDGKVSVTTALGAAHGPLLLTVNVYCKVVPVVTGSGLSALVIARSAELVTPVSVCVADSSPAPPGGSGSTLVTLAV